MATSTYKILGQAKPAATTLTDLYTAPALTQAVISSIVVCNQSNASTSYRLSQAIGGAADSPPQYLAWDVPIAGNAVHTLTLGLSLGAADKVRCYNTLATLSFNISGVEVLP